MLHWILTGLVFAASAGLVALSHHKATRPFDESRPSVIPWKFLMALGLFVGMLCIVHAVNLSGMETGRDSGFSRW